MQSSAVNLGWFALIVGGHKAQGGAGSEHHSIKINHQDHVHPATISVMIIANIITNRACVHTRINYVHTICSPRHNDYRQYYH